MDTKKLRRASQLVEDFKDAVTTHTIARLVDAETGELLWSCHDGKKRSWMRNLREVRVELDVDIDGLLDDLPTT